MEVLVSVCVVMAFLLIIGALVLIVHLSERISSIKTLEGKVNSLINYLDLYVYDENGAILKKQEKENDNE